MRVAIYILFAFLCLFPSISTQLLTPLNLSSEQYHSLSKKGINIKYFELKIPKKIEDEDLVVMVRPVEDIGDPDIYISTKNQNPDGFENSEIRCTTNGLDICTVDSANITDNSIFYIGVKCYTECSFAIRADYDSVKFFSLQLNPNSDTYSAAFSLFFEKNEAKIVKFYIPENDHNFQRILIKAQQTHPYLANESFSIYMKEGNTPPTTSRYDYKGLESWNSGQCIMLSNDEGEPWRSTKHRDFCSEKCNYTILVQAPANSTININVQGYNDMMKVKLNQNIQDMVIRNSMITYELDIDSSLNGLQSQFNQISLILTLSVFSGNPDIYVHYDTKPLSLDKYHWKSVEDIKESLVITPKERQAVGASDTKFYITVHGKLTSTFSLWIGTSHSFAFLSFGIAQTGTILNDEIINYRLFLFGSDNLNISLTLQANSGNPDLYVKMCILNDTSNDWRSAREERLKCALSLDDVANRYKKVPNGADLFLFSDNVGGKDSITFFHDAEKCSRSEVSDMPINFNKCMYLVGIHGNSLNQNESRYSLVATYNQQHVVLSEGSPSRSKGELGQYSYFKFTLLNEDNIESLKFQLTEISGRVTAYSSKIERYPTSKKYEKVAYSHWGFIHYNNSEGSLIGTYYIGILSESASTFSIVPLVLRKSKEGSKKELFTYLYEGSPQHYSFIYNSEEKNYFVFKTSKNNISFSGSNDIYIHLNSIKGKFAIYVLNTLKNDGRPSSTLNHFISFANSLLIRNTSEFYSSTGKYLVYIEPINPTNTLYEFDLQYSTSSSMKTLSSSHGYSDVLQNNSYSYYRCEAHKGDQSIEISINVDTYNPFYKSLLSVFFSFSSNNPFPDEVNNEYNTTVQNNIWILVENSDLKTNCPFLFNEKLNYTKQCVFYMAIRSYEFSSDVSYKVSIKRNVIETKSSFNFYSLNDDAQLTVPYSTDENKNSYYFLYKIHTNNTLHLSAYTTLTYGSSFYTLNAEIKSLPNVNSDELKALFPTNTSKTKIKANSEFHPSVSLTIKDTQFTKLDCFKTVEGCGLFITIIGNNNYYNDYYQNKTLTVEVTVNVNKLKPGTPLKGYVDDNEIKYYKLFINDPNTTILISLTPLTDGDPDLVVNRGENKNYPTIYDFDFASKNLYSDQIAIEHKKNESDSSSDVYIIGVYGKKKCSFILTASYGNFKVIDVYSSSPQDISIKRTEKVYIKYDSYYNKSMRIIFSRDFGDYLYAINTFKKNEDFVEKLPDFKKKNYYWSNMDDKELNYIYISDKDKNYCSNCSYLILIEAEKDTQLTLLISSLNETIYLQPSKSFKDFVPKKEFNSYVSYFYDDPKRIVVNIMVYQGKIKAYIGNEYDINPKNALNSQTNEKQNYIELSYETKTGSAGSELDFIYVTMVSVLIEGLSNANYTISVRSEGKERFLKYGVVEYAKLLPLASQNFTFYSNTAGNEDKSFSLSITKQSNFTNVSIDELNTKLFLIKNKSLPAEPIIPSSFVTTSESFYIVFQAFQGQFIIQINSASKKSLDFTVSLNFDGIDLIYPDHSYFNYLNPGKMSYYQMLVKEQNRVLVEVFQCSGRVKLYSSKSQSNLMNSVSDLKNSIDLSLSSESHLISLFETKTKLDNIYIGLKYLEGVKENKTMKNPIAKYMLRTHYLNSLETPYEVFFPGNDGNVFFHSKDEKIIFSARKLICEKNCKDVLTNSLKNSIKQYHYYIVLGTNNQVIDDFTRCGIHNLTNVLLGFGYQELIINNSFDTNEDLEFSFDLNNEYFKEDQDYYAKVIAKVSVEEAYNVQPYTFFYKTVQFYPKNVQIIQGESSSTLIWILILVLIGFIGAAFLAFYLFKKFKHVEKQLNYELQDVRNVAHVEQSKTTKGYKSLMEENKA